MTKGSVDTNRYLNKRVTILRNPLRYQSPDPQPDSKEISPCSDGALQRPWRRITRKRHKGDLFVLARRNYKIHADLGFTRRDMARFEVTLDTGAGSSFVRKDVIPEKYWPSIRPLREDVRVRDAGNRSVRIAGTLDLVVNIGSRLETVRFYVVDKLAVTVILGCDFCDKHVDSIRPRKRTVVLDDGTEVPILKKPEPRGPDAIPLPRAQEYVPAGRKPSDKI